MNIVSRAAHWVLLAALAVGLSGCGGSEFKLAPVKGKFVHQGKAVTGGSVTFRPVGGGGDKTSLSGKPASAVLSADGTFALQTVKPGDGAVVGKHQVLYSAPTPEIAKSYEDQPARSPYEGLVPKPSEVEVKAGNNDLEFELVPRGGAPTAAAPKS